MPQTNSKDVNFFRPAGKAMKGEVRVILLVLAGWLVGIMGTQAATWLWEYSSQRAVLSSWTFFNLPIPLWLTGQFLPLWFIILCVLFNFWMDRNAGRDAQMTLRFRVRVEHGGEVRHD